MTEAAKYFCIDAITHNNNLPESELEIIVGKSTIVRTLNNLGDRCKKTKLRVKNYDQQKMASIDWCMRHVNSTNFYPAFFTDECTFYLDSPSGSRWVKVDEVNLIYSKNKGRKIGAWQEFLIKVRHLFSYMKIK